MSGLVEEIQKDALDGSIPVSVLLRKVKLAATKLNLDAVEDWVVGELTGYEDRPVPAYRIVTGVPMFHNHYFGWQQIRGDTSRISRRGNGSSVSELEDLAERGEQGLFMDFPPQWVDALNETNGTRGELYALSVDRSGLIGILDRVRNLVLDWAITLEENGVLGSGISFRPEEVEKAHSSMAITIHGNVSGNVGSGNTARDISQNTANWSAISEFADRVEKAMPALSDDGIDTASLSKSVIELRAEAAKPKPDHGVTTGLLTDIRNAISGATGSLIASGILYELTKLL